VGEPQRYGTSNGPGPLHLLVDYAGSCVTLCGVARFREGLWRPSDVERKGVCPRCKTAARVASREPASRPEGPDEATPAILKALAARRQADEALAALIAANKGAFAWLSGFPDERHAFIARLRNAGMTLDDVGQLLKLTRERVRQVEAGPKS